MNDANITVIIAGNTYALRSNDLRSMRDIPAKDRDQLIDLLEMLKAQREKSERLVQNTLAKNTGNHMAARSAISLDKSAQPAERLGKGDVDAIMARLIVEEKQRQKPGLKPSTIYKFAAAIVVIIVLLSIF